MGIAAVAGVGIPAQAILAGRIVQRVIQLADRRRRVAERRVGGDVFHTLAVNVDFAAVLQTFQVFGAGERAFAVGTKVFWFHRVFLVIGIFQAVDPAIC